MEMIEQLNAAYGRFMATLERAAEPDLGERALNAYNAYTARLTAALNEPAATEMNQALETYRTVVSAGLRGPEAGGQIRAAYQTYLTEARAAWAGCDPSALAPADLATFGQSLQYLAWLVETGLDDAGALHKGDNATA